MKSKEQLRRLEATLAFHQKAIKLYEAYGQQGNAEAARRAAEACKVAIAKVSR